MLGLRAILVVCLPAYWFAGRADAVVILSGDCNIASALNGSNGAPVNEGNKRFFGNVLAGGDKVVVHGDVDPTGANSLAPVPLAINGYFNSLPGASSSIFSGVIGPATFAGGVDLFFAVAPDDAYAAGEVLAMHDFVNAGGTIFFMGENGDNYLAANARINAALASLGTGLSLLNTSFDTGYHTVSGGNITPDPFTTGVTTFTYAYSTATSGGMVLVRSRDNWEFVTYVPEPSAAALGGALALTRRRTRRRP